MATKYTPLDLRKQFLPTSPSYVDPRSALTKALPYADSYRVALSGITNNSKDLTNSGTGGGQTSFDDRINDDRFSVQSRNLSPLYQGESLQFNQMVDPSMYNAEELAQRYGNITYKRDDIRKLFNDATTQQATADRAIAQRLIDQQDRGYADLALAQRQAREQQMASAVQSGASRGMVAAENVLSDLGMMQDNSAQRLEALQALRDVDYQEQANLASNASKAMQEANAVGAQLGNLGANLYTAENERRAAELGYKAQIEGANVGASAAQQEAEAALLGSEMAARSNIAAAQLSKEGQIGAADRSMESYKYSADKNYDAQVHASNLNWDANKFNSAITMMGQLDLLNKDDPAAVDAFNATWSDLLGFDLGYTRKATRTKEKEEQDKTGTVEGFPTYMYGGAS